MILPVNSKNIDELNLKLAHCFYTHPDHYKYFFSNGYFSGVSVSNDSWTGEKFAIIDNGDIIGMIDYLIDRHSNIVHSLAIINFKSYSKVEEDRMSGIIFAKALKEILERLFNTLNMRKLNFTVVVGNPAEKSYDRFVDQHGGRIVGIYTGDYKLLDNKLYDKKIYEIINPKYIPS